MFLWFRRETTEKNVLVTSLDDIPMPTHIPVVRNIVPISGRILYGQVSNLRHLLPILPFDERTSELCDILVMSLPPFEINRTPDAFLSCKDGPHLFECDTHISEISVNIFDLFVIFGDLFE